MLKCEDIRFRYGRTGPLVLNGASLELKAGEIGILLGKNGAGKTTLFKSILGIQKPSGGCVTFDGENLLKRRGGSGPEKLPTSPRIYSLESSASSIPSLWAGCPTLG